MKSCPKCKNELEDSASFCSDCGAKYVENQPVQKHSNSTTILIVLLALVGLLLGNAYLQHGKTTTRVKPSFNNTQNIPVKSFRPTSSSSNSTKRWHHVAEWAGSAIKNTETFNIPSHEWRITWATQPGQYGAMNFQIYIYNSSGELISLAANVIGENSDSTILRGSGQYYLTINSAQPYEITVEAKY